MMITLYDDAQIMKNHDADLTRTVTERVKDQSKTESIISLMEKLQLSVEEAMDALSVPSDERSRYKELLAKQ